MGRTTPIGYSGLARPTDYSPNRSQRRLEASRKCFETEQDPGDPFGSAKLAKGLRDLGQVAVVERGVSPISRIGIERQLAFGLFAHDGSIGQLGRKRNLAPEAYGLDPGTKAFLIFDAAFIKPCVSGFMDDRSCDHFQRRVVMTDEFLFKAARAKSRRESA